MTSSNTTNGMTRELFSSNTEWEPIVGYSRAVKVGAHVFVAGTTATDEKGMVVGPYDAYVQTKQAIENVARALAKAGASLNDVVRTRLFVTDISRWQEYGRAHGEFFRDIRPASSMIEISRLIDPTMVVEVEVDALIAG